MVLAALGSQFPQSALGLAMVSRAGEDSGTDRQTEERTDVQTEQQSKLPVAKLWGEFFPRLLGKPGQRPDFCRGSTRMRTNKSERPGLSGGVSGSSMGRHSSLLKNGGTEGLV